MATVSKFEKDVLEQTHQKLIDISEMLDDIRDWADDQGYPAIAHKIEEGWGRINSAATAARQYADGELERDE